MASIISIADVQDEVERLLRRCEEEILRQVAVILKIEEEGKEKRQLVREISGAFDEIEDDEQKLAAFSSLLPVLAADIQGKMRTLLGCAKKEEVSDFSESGRVDTKEDAVSKSDITEEGVTNQTVALLKLLGLNSAGTSAFRKECKISGTIGGTNETQRLNYISLCTQVGDLKRKGFESDEIVSAIRKAIPSGTELRTYLDSLPLISLDDILTLIRSAYKEKSTTELFRQLDKLCQHESEDGPAFLFRALSLRQRILKAAEAEGEIHYDRSQVVSVFMHSVRTGLMHEAVRSHMAQYLDARKDPPDHVLMLEMNKAQDELSERLSKQKDAKPKVRFAVNEASASSDSASASSDSLVKTLLSKIDTLTDEMKVMKEDLGRLQKKDDTWKGGRKGQSSNGWKRRGCDDCVEKNNASCNHCWACGADGHLSRNCQKSSNRKGLREKRDGH